MAEQVKDEELTKKVDIEIEDGDAEETLKEETNETVEKEAKAQESDLDKESEETKDSQEESEDAAEDSQEESEDTAEDSQEPKKKGIFKKKKDKKDEKIAELDDRIKRQMAEFDNFRKRSEKEKSQMFDMGAKTILEKILPVIDNFERGFTTLSEDEKKDNAFADGMDKVYKQLLTELEAAGVKAIECVGKEFDPELHNAVMQVESEDVESGFVAQELLKGYTYKDEVLRHSMVAVAQ